MMTVTNRKYPIPPVEQPVTGTIRAIARLTQGWFVYNRVGKIKPEKVGTRAAKLNRSIISRIKVGQQKLAAPLSSKGASPILPCGDPDLDPPLSVDFPFDEDVVGKLVLLLLAVL